MKIRIRLGPVRLTLYAVCGLLLLVALGIPFVRGWLNRASWNSEYTRIRESTESDLVDAHARLETRVRLTAIADSILRRRGEVTSTSPSGLTVAAIDELLRGREGPARLDAWGNAIRVEIPDGAAWTFVLRSAGPDGQPNTEDDLVLESDESELHREP